MAELLMAATVTNDELSAQARLIWRPLSSLPSSSLSLSLPQRPLPFILPLPQGFIPSSRPSGCGPLCAHPFFRPSNVSKGPRTTYRRQGIPRSDINEGSWSIDMREREREKEEKRGRIDIIISGVSGIPCVLLSHRSNFLGTTVRDSGNRDSKTPWVEGRSSPPLFRRISLTRKLWILWEISSVILRSWAAVGGDQRSWLGRGGSSGLRGWSRGRSSRRQRRGERRRRKKGRREFETTGKGGSERTRNTKQRPNDRRSFWTGRGEEGPPAVYSNRAWVIAVGNL